MLEYVTAEILKSAVGQAPENIGPKDVMVCAKQCERACFRGQCLRERMCQHGCCVYVCVPFLRQSAILSNADFSQIAMAASNGDGAREDEDEDGEEEEEEEEGEGEEGGEAGSEEAAAADVAVPPAPAAPPIPAAPPATHLSIVGVDKCSIVAATISADPRFRHAVSHGA